MISIKTSKDGKRQYYYFQHTVRPKGGGKPKSPSIYIGPVNPKRKKRGGLAIDIPIGLLALALMGAMGKLKAHKPEKVRLSPHPRAAAVRREQFEEARQRSKEDGKLVAVRGGKRHDLPRDP